MSKKKEKDMLDLICDNIIENFNLVTFQDVSKLNNELIGKIVQSMLETEMDHHLDYKKNSKEEKNTDNRRNGYSSKGKEVKTEHGKIVIDMPRDRDGSFEPVIVGKRQRVVKTEDFENTIISMYAKGVTDRDICQLVKDIYKIDLSPSFISDVVSKVSDEVNVWRNRPLKELYTFLYVDCVYVNIKRNLISEKRPIYNIIGVDVNGYKEVVGTWIGNSNSEATYFWRQIFEELKERGVKDILFTSLDGLAGLSEAINEVFPQTKVQRCIVHLSRNLYQLCPKKGAKEIIADFKKIYSAPTLEMAQAEFKNFTEKYADKRSIVKKVEDDMQYIIPLFEVPQEIRKVIYTSNAVESVNSAYRKVTNGKGSFPNEDAVNKVLYLRVQDLQKKWNKPIPNWKTIIVQLVELFGERITKYMTI